jgi:hypothetical protein
MDELKINCRQCEHLWSCPELQAFNETFSLTDDFLTYVKTYRHDIKLPKDVRFYILITSCSRFKLKEKPIKTTSDIDELMRKVKLMDTDKAEPFTDDELSLMSSLGLSL